MNKFPCKNCLIKACCSEYCDQLETHPSIIDIYIVSLKTCPDCGGTINTGSSLNKTSRICFNCSKAFTQQTFVRMSINKTRIVARAHHMKGNWTMSPTPTISTSNIILGQKPVRKPIIIDLTKHVPKISVSESMEETHDVFYARVDKSASNYLIKNHVNSIIPEIMKKPRKVIINIGNPSWINNYECIGECNIEDSDGLIFI